MRAIKRNFTGGEVAETMPSRNDLARYEASCHIMENFIAQLHGGARFRPGTEYLARHTASDAPVLMPFEFNIHPANQYVLLFRHNLIEIYRPDGTKTAEVVTAYTAAQIRNIRYVQQADVVFLAHPEHPLRMLSRHSHTSWDLSPVSFEPPISLPDDIVVEVDWKGQDVLAELAKPVNFTADPSATDDDAVRYQYAVSAENNDGESFPTDREPVRLAAGAHLDLSWENVEGASRYNIYKTNSTGASSLFLFRTVAANGALARSSTRIYEPDAHNTDMTVTPVTSSEEHSFRQAYKITAVDENGQESYPSPAFDTLAYPASEWVAKDYITIKFDHSVPEAVSYNIYKEAGSWGYIGTVDAPEYPAVDPLTFRDDNFAPDVTYTPPVENNPFYNKDGTPVLDKNGKPNHPSFVTIHQQRLVVGGSDSNPSTFYLSRTGDYKNFSKSNPLRDDDSLEYTLSSSRIEQIRWGMPFGDLLIGTVGSEHEVLGSPLTPSNVQIRAQSFWGSGSVPPLVIGNSILQVQRQGSRVRDLSYSMERDGYAGTDLSVMASHLFDGHEIVSWAYQSVPGSVVWCVRDDGVLLGLSYLKEHEIWGWHRHITSGKVRSVCVLSQDDEDVLYLIVERDVTGSKQYCLERMAPQWRKEDGLNSAWFLDCARMVESEAEMTSVTGLAHLNGADVTVFADGLIYHGIVVTDSAITLPVPAKKVLVGLPYTGIISPLPVEAETREGTTQGLTRQIGEISLRLFESCGGKAAIEGINTGREPQYEVIEHITDEWDSPAQPFTGIKKISAAGFADTELTVFVKQDQPLPFNLLSITMGVNFGQN